MPPDRECNDATPEHPLAGPLQTTETNLRRGTNGLALTVAAAVITTVGALPALAAKTRERERLAVSERRTPKPQPRKPNVVMIMTDDQTLQSLSMMLQTRRLLGGRGVTFANAFSSWPLCAPSRATYLTGQYAWNHRVAGNLAPSGGYSAFIDRQYDTLPVWLQQRGYYTAHVGKYLNGYGRDAPANVPPGWSDWQGSVDPSTYFMWGYTLNDNGTPRTYGAFDVEDPALYQTVVYRRLAIQQIKQAAKLRKPLFLNVAGIAPHFEGGTRGDKLPPRAEPRYKDVFNDAALPNDPSFNEADTTDKPAFMQAFYRPFDDSETAAITTRYRGELDSLKSVDDSVAAIVGALKRTGQLANTYIFFTSDNGYFHGEHRIPKTKFWLYDPAARVPLLVRGPGIAGGRISREMVSNVDLAATIAGIAGARPRHPLDGRSLLPFARRPARRTGRPQLFSALRGEGGGEGGNLTNPQRLAPGYDAIRTDRYLYVEYTTGDRELYDLQIDPYELQSQVLNPAYLPTHRALAAALAERRGCVGSACNKALGSIPAPSAMIRASPLR